MEEVRQLVQEEGREARNLIAFHVSMDTPGPKLLRKPPKISPPSSAASKVIRRVPCRGQASRLRSASAGRDKRSELQARYWALLFGNLQRAIGEIYTTVESHENLSECQEVILVLENYTRDFKSLCEWFRLKWEYDNTPPPQRPQSLAWEVRKTDFVRPESKKASSLKSSPSVSGKNSPSLSGRNTPTGKNSPSLNTGKASPGSGKLSPRIQATSPKTNQEFFGVKNFPSKIGSRLSDIKETPKDDINVAETNKLKQLLKIEIENVDSELKSTAQVNGSNDVDTKTGDLVTIADDKKTAENDVVKTVDKKETVKLADPKKSLTKELSTQAKATIAALNKMEDDFLKTQNETKKVECKKTLVTEKSEAQPKVTKESNNEVVKSDLKHVDSKKVDVKPAVSKPAYSQAAAKPKVTTSKPDLKPKTTYLSRSKTIAEIRPSQSKTTIVNRVTTATKRNVKCSYPFNLTTGRTSLFESNARNAKNPAKNVKVDNKKPILKPKTETEKSDSKNDSNSTLTRIESNESVKTLVPEGGSIEVLNVKDENDGWLTVKSRRLSRAETKNKGKSHWLNRFNQPSATTSLPTLCIADSPRQVSVEKTEDPKEQVKSDVPKPQSQSMIRQKSDVTGLRSRNRNRGGKSAKNVAKSDMTNDATRLHSSLESLLPIGLSRSQESTEGSNKNENWKLDFKLDFIEDEYRLLNKARFFQNSDPLEMSEIAEMTCEIEENERKMSLALDFQSDFDQQKLIEEEDSLNRQIRELQTVSDFELDIETDDTETDAEILCDDDSKTVIVNVEFNSEENLENATAASLENRYEPALASMSWADRMDTLAKLEALVARYPGRAQQLHSKLSQGIRRRGSLQETLKRCIIKQDRAERQRQEFQREKSEKIHHLLARVEDVKTAKNQLIEEKRLRMEQRLQKAAEKRDQHLKDRVRKAHDEEEKLKEIAFIKQLEAENRRHDFLVQCKTRTQRLRQLRRDRLMRLEQKAEHSAAVGARRTALEAARIQRVTGILERTNHRAHRLKEQNSLRAKEKAESLRSRLSAMAAAAEAETESLRNKIQNKQEESKARHDIHLNAVRSRARPNTASDTNEQSVKDETTAEVQHELSKDKLKAQRKKMRKIKQKLLMSGEQYDSHRSEELHHTIKSKTHKALSQIYKMLQPLLQAQEKTNDDLTTKKTKQTSDEMSKDLNDPAKNKKNKKEKSKLSEQNLNKEPVDGAKSKKKLIKESDCKAIIENAVEAGKIDGQDKIQNGDCEVITEVPLENNVKRKRGKSDLQRQTSRVNSVGSSVSDVGSLKFDECQRIVNSLELNATILERSINELWRSVEKIDKIPLEKASLQISPTLKILSGVLLLAAERENCDITIKTIQTCLFVMKTLLVSSPSMCMHFLKSNGPVHITQLMINYMGRPNLQAKEHQLVNSLADCLAIIMETLSRITKVVEDEKSKKTDCTNTSNGSGDTLVNDSDVKGASLNCDSRNKGDRVERIFTKVFERCDVGADEAMAVYELRQRAHTLISFILCTPFNQVEGVQAIDRLVVSIARNCSPSIVDPVKDSSERQSALSSLRAACSSRGGSLAARTCSVLAAVAVEELKEDYSMFVASMRALAELDHTILKECLGSGVEFKAAASKLLTAYAPSDRESQGNMLETKVNSEKVSESTEKMLLDLIATIGYYAVGDVKCAWVPRALASLPASWLCGSRGRIVNCTLAALADTDDISVEMLEEFLVSEEAKDLKMVKLIKENRTKKGATTAK